MAIDNDVLKTRVKAAVQFIFYRDGELWYRAVDGWQFPIPVVDTMNAQGGRPTFNAEERGMTLMRWIRKHMETELSWQAEGHVGA